MADVTIKIPKGFSVAITRDKSDRDKVYNLKVNKSTTVDVIITEPPVITPPPVIPPPVVVPPTVSPDGTTVPPAASIFDAQLAVWALADDTAAGGRSILKNGTNFAGGSGVLLLWKNAKIYTKNNGGAWYLALADSWQMTGDPTAGTPPVIPPPVVTPPPEPTGKLKWTETLAYLQSKNALVRAFDFADASQLGANQYGANFGWEPGGSGNPQIDTSVAAHPGGGSLKFTVPGLSGAKAGGEWYANFSADLETRFGANTEFWLRWTERKNQAMCDVVLADPGAGTGIKTMILGNQDGPNAGGGANPNVAVSSERMKLVVQTYNEKLPRFPIMYRYNQAMQNDYLQTKILRPEFTTPDYWLQNAIAGCTYTSDKSACFPWTPDKNDVYTLHVKIGAYDDTSYPNPVFANSEVQLYIQRQGESRVKVIDYKPGIEGYEPLRAVPEWQYGKVNFGPYITSKVATQNHPEMALWVTDFLVSKIDPGEAADEMISGGALPLFDWTLPPLNEWYEVPNTDFLSAASKISGDYNEFGNGGFPDGTMSGIFYDWSGAAFDYSRGRLYPFGGAHHGTNCNVLFKFDLRVMKWIIARQPSPYNSADVEAGYALHVAAGNAGVTWGPSAFSPFGWGVTYDPAFLNKWKDGKATTIHTYGAMAFCEGTNDGEDEVLIHHIGNIFSINPATGAQEDWTGAGWTSDNSSVYDPVTETWFLFRIEGSDNFSYRTLHVPTRTLSTLKSLSIVTYTGSPVIFGRKIFFFQDGIATDSAPIAVTLDMDTEVEGSVTLTGHPARSGSGPYGLHSHFAACDYCSDNGYAYFLHRPATFGGSCGTWGSFTKINPATGACSVYTPSGTPPPLRNVGFGAEASPYGKFRIYENSHGSFMVLFDNHEANLHIVRIA